VGERSSPRNILFYLIYRKKMKRIVAQAKPQIAPSYYPDMTLEMIGKRPVYSVRNQEFHIPEILKKDKTNLPGHDAGCFQPNWSPNCV